MKKLFITFLICLVSIFNCEIKETEYVYEECEECPEEEEKMGVISWTSRTSQFGASTIWGACWSEALSLFIIVGDSGKISTSPDGINWTAQTGDHGTSNILGVAAADDIVVSVGETGKLASSTDGETWTARTSQFGTTNIQGVCWSPDLDLFVAVGEGGGDISTSPDGINWTARTGPTNTDGLHDVCWSPELELFCAVGNGNIDNNNPTIVTSPDGTTWSYLGRRGSSTFYCWCI